MMTDAEAREMLTAALELAVEVDGSCCNCLAAKFDIERYGNPDTTAKDEILAVLSAVKGEQ